MSLTDDAGVILADVETDARDAGYDPDLERETGADVAAYWADMDAAVEFRAWEDAQDVTGGWVDDGAPW